MYGIIIFRPGSKRRYNIPPGPAGQLEINPQQRSPWIPTRTIIYEL